jgi:16S rRNA (cytosine967-C5)-methyltransferase
VTGIQSRLLDIAATLVKPGGRIIFVTCSLLDAEGADQVQAFLRRDSRWQAEGLDLGRVSRAGQASE